MLTFLTQLPAFDFCLVSPGLWRPQTYTVDFVDLSCLQQSDLPQLVFNKGPINFELCTPEFELCFKSGRSPGSSWGFVNAINADIHILGETQYTLYTAIDVVPPLDKLHDFNEPGDSGSWILSKIRISLRDGVRWYESETWPGAGDESRAGRAH